jgi:NAD(P)-dependent dehydrogenase (short-subunit alcohol dehydrogenase family)
VSGGRVLEGRRVLVTGAGRGVGRAHALACARAGARVLANDLGCDAHGQGADPSVAAAVVDAIRDAGGTAEADHEDLGRPAGPQRVVEATTAAFGGLDAVIGSAGIVADRTVLKMDDALLDRMIDVHVKGSFALVKAAARAMIDAGNGGSIVLHTAPVAFFGALRQSALAATSAAIVGLVRSAAIELRKHGIRVNAIAPTARTRTTEALPLFKGIAPDSMGPEFVAPVGVFLASDLASEVSGEVVGVAGTRLYALNARETPGWFGEGAPPSPEEVARAWNEVTRP